MQQDFINAVVESYILFSSYTPPPLAPN